ncbi:MAG TPA: dihydrolipoamide acetyltransferase family protein [Polyangiaceae bacterium]|nr:dihydrolipoamide acetyltransferase family protein [Polyangiaceae bacterium]
MAKILEMPKLSPTMEEGVLSAWHKKEGDAVNVDDLLAEVETDKATMEFRAFDKGTLLKLLVSAGANVKLGQPVAVLGSPGEDIAALLAKTDNATVPTAQPSSAAQAPATAQPAAAPAPGQSASQTQPAARTPPAISPTMPPPETIAPPAQRRPPMGSVLERTSLLAEPVENGARGAAAADAGAGAGGRVVASPYVRKQAREMGIDLAGAQGTGPGGRVLPADLEGLRAPPSSALARAPQSPAAPIVKREDARAESEIRPLSPMRKTIARRLTESKQQVPHFYLTIDADASSLVRLREQINAELAAESGGGGGAKGSNGAGEGAQPTKISLNDLLIKACAVALVNVPECNASFTPDAILVHKRVDISVAVAIPDGLVTPVVRNADKKNVVAIAREVRELASRARARKLKPEEMADGTFSISNLGMFGIDQFAAVINPPEGAILAVGQVRDVPVVSEGAVVAGKRLGMTLSCDHRVVDGAVGAAFLAELRRLIEHPLRVLTG